MTGSVGFSGSFVFSAAGVAVGGGVAAVVCSVVVAAEGVTLTTEVVAGGATTGDVLAITEGREWVTLVELIPKI